jgi:hypothetical protein
MYQFSIIEKLKFPIERIEPDGGLFLPLREYPVREGWGTSGSVHA